MFLLRKDLDNLTCVSSRDVEEISTISYSLQSKVRDLSMSINMLKFSPQQRLINFKQEKVTCLWSADPEEK